MYLLCTCVYNCIHTFARRKDTKDMLPLSPDFPKQLASAAAMAFFEPTRAIMFYWGFNDPQLGILALIIDMGMNITWGLKNDIT